MGTICMCENNALEFKGLKDKNVMKLAQKNKKNTSGKGTKSEQGSRVTHSTVYTPFWSENCFRYHDDKPPLAAHL